MLDSVLVSPCVRVELTCEEDFLSLLEEIPRDDLLVLVELLLEDDATEEACLFAVLGEVLRECEACESHSFVRCHVGCKSMTFAQSRDGFISSIMKSLPSFLMTILVGVNCLIDYICMHLTQRL